MELFYGNGTSQCTLPYMRLAYSYHTQSGDIVCGGKTCDTFRDGTWKPILTLPKDQEGHCSWTRPDGMIQLMGGINNSLSTDTLSIPLDVDSGVVMESNQVGFSLKHFTLYGFKHLVLFLKCVPSNTS